MSWAEGMRFRARTLIERALRESPSPHKRALSVASGVFVSAAPVPPVFGLRSLAVLILATLLRGNRLLALVGSQLFFGPLWLVAVTGEVWLGSLILGRAVPDWGHDAESRLAAAKSAVGAWMTGSAVTATTLALLTYGVVRLILRWRAQRLAAASSSGGNTP